LLIILFAAGYFLRIFMARWRRSATERESREILKQAQADAEKIKKEKIFEAREALHQEKEKWESELEKIRREILNQEEKMSKKLDYFDKKERDLDKKQESLSLKERDLQRKDENLDRAEKEILQKKEEQVKILEQVAHMSEEEAKKILVQEMTEEAKRAAQISIVRIEEEARVEAEKRAQMVIATSVQRISSDYIPQITTTQLSLPSEDLKGRIIGREGRNIRAFEAATGVEIIIDDTPGMITLSSFDGVRREVAKLSLERLVADGRIHPGRIEEIVNKVQADMEKRLFQIGEETVFEMGVEKVHPDIKKVLGRLRYRTSYGQNILQHSIEVAKIASSLAGELNANVSIAKRAGLFHDLGKALDERMEGSHAATGAELARRCGESDVVVKAIQSHHEEIPLSSIYDFISYSADALSASRPGARMESIDQYIKRVKKLEEIASSFPGVDKAFALQAGREIRVLVDVEKISDVAAGTLARDIAKKIEESVEYPGQVKILVIREVRKQEIAK
ncbi:MAG TPA: ribonuclease Y, partial [bacterium]|nr:ribonuclease Y [bacterium]